MSEENLRKTIDGRAHMDWSDENEMAFYGSDVDYLMDIITQQIRETAKATGEEYIRDSRWSFVYDPNTMTLTIQRVLPS